MKTFRRIYSDKVVRPILAKSGNRCAFPNCDQPLFTEGHLFVGQWCHIEAVSPGGSRFNPDSTEKQINSYENLMLLCYRHHKEIDHEPTVYTVERLRRIKGEHETKFKEGDFELEEDALKGFLLEINSYWDSIDRANKEEHGFPEQKLDIDAKADPEKLLAEIHGQIESLDAVGRILMAELKNDYFEIVCLWLPNVTTRLQALIDQLEIRILELKVANDPTNEGLKAHLEDRRVKFKETAKSISLND